MRFLALIITSLAVFAIFQYGCAGPSTSATNTQILILGRSLFFDNRISFNQTKSCGSCHDPKFAFSDGYRRSITANGEIVRHNAPSLVNAAVLHYLDWNNPSVTDLLHQSDRPLFNQSPIELGARGNEELILGRLSTDRDYQLAFSQSFPGDPQPFNFRNIQQALKAFVGSLQSMNAAYDHFLKGDSSALSLSARKGRELFFSDRLKCISCHTPPYFTSAAVTKNIDSIYFNTGLYNVRNLDEYPGTDTGLEETTGKKSDNGKFKTPSLRNVALTAPYTHDGSVSSLEEMIDIYARGGRLINNGPQQGDGRMNQNKDSRLAGFELSTTEKKQLIDFLFSLTDSSILKAPAFQNPFKQGKTEF